MRKLNSAHISKSSVTTHRITGMIAILIAVTVTGCTTAHERMTSRAYRANASDIIVASNRFQQRLFRNQADLSKSFSDTLLIFLEGDGLPWINNGSTPASDPTPRKPLAFTLFLATHRPAWYLTRPCYNNLLDGCDSHDWTEGRYSERIVSSMASAIHSQLTAQADKAAYKNVVLIGYSGGGALATLIAARLSFVTGVISIVGNLDTQAWSEHHHYEPLTSSINPTDLNPLAIPQLILIGDKDTNVPSRTIARYLERQPNASVKHFEQYDHVCCWQSDWTALLESSLQQLNLAVR